MKKPLMISGLILGAATLAFAAVNSGLDKGESVSPFHPKHVAGPLKGGDACFPCTYQNRPQVQAWVTNGDQKSIVAFAKTLDAAMSKYAKNDFKAMVVIVAPDAMHKMIEESAPMMAKSFKNVDISYLSPSNPAVKAYKINTKAENTIFAYKDWKVENKMVNLKADEKGLADLDKAVAMLVK
jgi:predicted lipid-binding transport protein (Tim44 family)